MDQGKFGLAINCIDGRAQVPVTDWMKFNCRVQYVNVITEPGIIQHLSDAKSPFISSIRHKVALSIKVHYTEVAAVVGHFDCKANPLDFMRQKLQILRSTELIENWNFQIRILGLYVNEWNSVDLIYDTEEKYRVPQSFL